MEELKHIDIEITKVCNLKCIHCSSEAGEGDILDIEFIKNSLSEGAKLGLRRVGFTGGEPFLFPKELSDLIDFSYKLDCPLHIHTNGTLYENLQIIQGRQEKIENLSITLLGDEAIHDLNCGLDGAYEKVKISARQILNYQIPLTVFLIPLSNNYQIMKKVAEDFYKIGARDFRVMRLSPGGRAREKYTELRLDEKQTASFISDINSLEGELDIKFSAGCCTKLVYPNLKPLEHHDLCMSGINRLHINADGYVFPCTASSGFIEMNIGCLYEDTLEDIWENSKKLKEFRKLSRRECRVQQHYLKGLK